MLGVRVRSHQYTVAPIAVFTSIRRYPGTPPVAARYALTLSCRCGERVSLHRYADTPIAELTPIRRSL